MIMMMMMMMMMIVPGSKRGYPMPYGPHPPQGIWLVETDMPCGLGHSSRPEGSGRRYGIYATPSCDLLEACCLQWTKCWNKLRRKACELQTLYKMTSSRQPPTGTNFIEQKKIAYKKYLLNRFCWLPAKLPHKMCVFWLVVCLKKCSGKIVA